MNIATQEPPVFHMTTRRLRRYEGHGVPEIDLWLAGPSHVFRRVTGLVDTGSSVTLLTNETAKLMFLPALGRTIFLRTASGRIPAMRSRLLMKLIAADVPPLTVLLPVCFTIPPADGVPKLDVNLFGADLCNIFSVSIDREAVAIRIT